MSFFDPMMVGNPLPKGWENFELHTEVYERDIDLIQFLEKVSFISLVKFIIAIFLRKCP